MVCPYACKVYSSTGLDLMVLVPEADVLTDLLALMEAKALLKKDSASMIVKLMRSST